MSSETKSDSKSDELIDSSSTLKECGETEEKRRSVTPSKIPRRVPDVMKSPRTLCTSSLPQLTPGAGPSATGRKSVPAKTSVLKAAISCGSLDELKRSLKKTLPLASVSPARFPGPSRRQSAAPAKDTHATSPHARCFNTKVGVGTPINALRMENLRSLTGLRRTVVDMGWSPLARRSPTTTLGGRLLRGEMSSGPDWTFCRKYRDLSVGDWNVDKAYNRITQFQKQLRDSCEKCELGRNILALVYPTDQPPLEMLGRVCVAIASYEKLHPGHSPSSVSEQVAPSHSDQAMPVLTQP